MTNPIGIMQNKTQQKNILKEFVNKYFELLEYMKKYSNNNSQFNNFCRKNVMLRKANMKIFMKVWYENITIRYFDRIMNDDVSYFLDKCYNNDFDSNVYNEYNMEQCISYMKLMYNKMNQEEINLFTKYIKELTFLSYLYNKVP